MRVKGAETLLGRPERSGSALSYLKCKKVWVILIRGHGGHRWTWTRTDMDTDLAGPRAWWTWIRMDFDVDRNGRGRDGHGHRLMTNFPF